MNQKYPWKAYIENQVWIELSININWIKLIKIPKRLYLINFSRKRWIKEIKISFKTCLKPSLDWFYWFFRVFSYIIDYHSFLNCCISTKLSQIVCLINVHILVCQHARCDCRLWKIFREFLYIITYLKRYNFIKHLQIVSKEKYRDENLPL